MKLIKALALTLVAVLLTGCYTQLQYSQKMKKLTDREEASYSGAEREQDRYESAQAEAEYSEYEYEGEEHIPVYYKDYEYANRYDECQCSPYNVYNFYGSYYDHYDHYGPYYSLHSHLSLSAHHFYKWRFSNYYGYRYPYSSFALSFSWGRPFYHSYYYDSFYHPYYASYWYGYRNPFAYNYYKFYGNYGQGYYGKVRNKGVSNRTYGPRSIGSNRVEGNVNRTRARTASSRDARVAGQSRVRSGSATVGTTRSRTNVTRSTNSGSTVKRSRGDGKRSQGNNSSENSRTRSRDNYQSDDYRTTDRSSGIIRYRSSVDQNGNSSSLRDAQDRNDLRSRVQLRRAPNVSDRDQKSRSTFFNRMKNFFESSTTRIGQNIKRSSGSTIRTRSSSTNRSSTINRSSRSNNSRSTVKRSNSSSNNSRSRGGASSSSRSRSGGGSSSSDSDRSRNN